MDPLELFNQFIELFAAQGHDFAVGDESAEERIARLSAELEGGRDLQDILDSLLPEVFEGLGIAGAVGDEDPDTKDTEDAARIAGELIVGDRSITDLISSLDLIVETTAGADSTIPAGAQLIRITDPTGSDAAVRYVVAYDINGLSIVYDIGDVDDFLDLFPSGEAGFDSVSTLSQGQFDDEGFLEVGAVDEILGQTESLVSQYERELTALGFEGLASWMANDPEALTFIATAASEDWSSTRLWSELSSTQGFAERYTAFEAFAITGETVEATIGRLISAENQVAAALIQFRPAGFEITTDYLQNVLLNGWDAGEVAAVLEAEQIIRNNPESLNQLNAILLASNLPTVDEAGLIEVIGGSGDLEVIEALNTAAAALALTEAGLEGIDIDLLVEIIDDVSSVRTAEDFQAVAQQLALSFAQNSFELDTGKFGLDREDVIATMFGEETLSGRSSGEVLNTLMKFERERRAAATGFGGTQAFVGQSGNLQITGFSGT